MGREANGTKWDGQSAAPGMSCEEEEEVAARSPHCNTGDFVLITPSDNRWSNNIQTVQDCVMVLPYTVFLFISLNYLNLPQSPHTASLIYTHTQLLKEEKQSHRLTSLNHDHCHAHSLPTRVPPSNSLPRWLTDTKQTCCYRGKKPSGLWFWIVTW